MFTSINTVLFVYHVLILSFPSLSASDRQVEEEPDVAEGEFEETTTYNREYRLPLSSPKQPQKHKLTPPIPLQTYVNTVNTLSLSITIGLWYTQTHNVSLHFRSIFFSFLAHASCLTSLRLQRALLYRLPDGVFPMRQGCRHSLPQREQGMYPMVVLL